MTDKDKRWIIAILKHYRIRADGLYSEVVDKFHTQKEYENALINLESECAENIQSLLDNQRKELTEYWLKRSEKRHIEFEKIARQELLQEIKSKLPEDIKEIGFEQPDGTMFYRTATWWECLDHVKTILDEIKEHNDREK